MPTDAEKLAKIASELGRLRDEADAIGEDTVGFLIEMARREAENRMRP